MYVYVLFETYDMMPRVFADRVSARAAMAAQLRGYRSNGWSVRVRVKGRDYVVKCEEEGRYQLFLDRIQVEGGAE